MIVALTINVGPMFNVHEFKFVYDFLFAAEELNQTQNQEEETQTNSVETTITIVNLDRVNP